MRATSLLLILLAVSAAGSLLPASAQAAKIPYCIQKVTGELCFYAVDRTDCIKVDGQDYCRTIGYFRWDI